MDKVKCIIEEGFTLQAILKQLISPLYHLDSAPTDLRAFRCTTAAGASRYKFLVSDHRNPGVLTSHLWPLQQLYGDESEAAGRVGVAVTRNVQGVSPSIKKRVEIHKKFLFKLSLISVDKAVHLNPVKQSTAGQGDTVLVRCANEASPLNKW